MTQPKSEKKKPRCGIIMPISEIDGCSDGHWLEVREIITEAADGAGFEARLVSESDDIGIIQDRIVQNIYDCEMVVADVSAKNANVMFELGMRLAFDKPAVVLKDDKTAYSFDTSPIEHLEYRRDLRYSEILTFKERLSSKLYATFEASKKKDYTTFLKHFGKFKVTGLEVEEVTEQEFLSKELSSIRGQMLRIERKLDDRERSPLASRRKFRVPLSQLVRKIEEGVNSGELTIKEMRNSPRSAFGYVYDNHKEIFTECGDVVEFEDRISKAVTYFLSKPEL